MKKTILLIALAILCSKCHYYKLPDAKVRAKMICGSCQPGNIGIPFQFYEKPYSPEIDSIVTTQGIAYAILGHVFPEASLRGDKAFACDKTSKSPFVLNDIRPFINSTGKKIKYGKKEKLQINVEAAVRANIDELKKLNPTFANWPEVEATLTAAYSKLKDKELVVTAVYSEWGLRGTIIEKLIKDEDFVKCKEYIKTSKMRMVTAVGIIAFSISFEQKSIESISSEVEAEVSKLGVKGSVSAGFKREISTSLTTSTENAYQIVNWRTIGIDDLDLLRTQQFAE
jgi:hypothetical protein